MLDALQRRVRWSPPQPFGKRLNLDDSDFDVWQNNYEFGDCLPTEYLHAFSGSKNYKTFQNKLTRFYNGFCSCGRKHIIPPDATDPTREEFPNETHQVTTYMWRDPSFNDRSSSLKEQSLLHSNTACANEVLRRKGRFSPFIRNADHKIHRLMRGTICASVKLACKEQGHGFISRTDIFSDARCTRKELSLPVSSRRAKTNHLAPDELFGIHADKKKRFFAFEADRGTEQVSRSDSERNTIYQKICGYLDVFTKRTYADVWGLPNLTVFFATTGEGRAKSMRDLATQLAEEHGHPELARKFIFAAFDEFYPPWVVPPIYTNVLNHF